MGVIGKLVGRTGSSKWVIGDIDMDGLSRWACACLLATSTVSSVTEMIQREAVREYNTLVVNIRIILLTKMVSTFIEGTSRERKTYQLSCPKCHLFQSQPDVLIRVLRADIAPTVWAWMLSTPQLLLHNSQFFTISKICGAISICLLLRSFN